MSSQGQPPLRTITIDLGKPLRSLLRLIFIPISTLYRVSKLNSVFVTSRVEMAGPRARDFEESVGLLANDDLYDADSDSAIRPTPEERNSPSPVIRPSKSRLPERNLSGKRDRRVNLLTKFSLCISGSNFLILITALIIIPAGKFSGSGSWTSTGYHHYKAEAATGLIVLSITVSHLPFNHFHPSL